MFGHLHLVHATRKQRHEGQANAAETANDAEDNSRRTATGIAVMLDAGEPDLLTERTGYGHGLPAQVRQEPLSVVAAGGGCVSAGIRIRVCVGRRCRRSGWRRNGVSSGGFG